VSENNKGTSQSQMDLEQLSQHFPAFLWVLRDFALKLENEKHEPITPRDYLENALRINPNTGVKIEEKNRIRQVITSVFNNRDCAVLVRPIMEEDKLQKLNDIPLSQLREEFKAGLEVVKNKIFQTATVKTFEGNFINGPAMAHLVQVYVKAMNEGHMPVIQTAWQSVVQLQSQIAYDQAEVYFNAESSKIKGPIEADQMMERIRLIEEEALRIFRRHAIGDNGLKQKHIDKLSVNFKISFARIQKENELSSKIACDGIIQSIWNTLKFERKKFRSEKELEDGFREIEREYFQKAVGPLKDQVYREFIEKKKSVIFQDILADFQQQQKESSDLKNQLNGKEQELANAKAQLIKLDTQKENQVKIEKELRQERENQAKAEKDLNQKMEKLQHALVQLEREKAQLISDHTSSAAKVGDQMAAKEREIKEAKQNIQTLQQKLQESEGGNKTKEQEIGKLTKEIQELKQNLERLEKNEQLASNFKSEAQQNLHQQKQKIIEVEEQLKAKNQEYKKLTEELNELKSNHHLQALNIQKSQQRIKELEESARNQEKEITKLKADLEGARQGEQRLQDYLQLKEKHLKELEENAKNQETEIAKLKAEVAEVKQSQANRMQFDTPGQHDNHMQVDAAQTTGTGKRKQPIMEFSPGVSDSFATPSNKKQKRGHAEIDNSDGDDHFIKSNTTPETKPTGSSVYPENINQAKRDDINKCNIQELKSWLTFLDVELPPTAKKKEVYLDLLEKELKKRK